VGRQSLIRIPVRQTLTNKNVFINKGKGALMYSLLLRIMVLAALSVVSAPFAAFAAASSKPAEVRLAYLNGPRPWILGKADGSLQKALGVPVKWVNLACGPDALKAVAAGEIDIARA
jgi:taurine transport system substrate-binding protein